MVVTLTALAAMGVVFAGAASAKSTSTMTYTLEYTGSYSFHRDDTGSTSGSTDEHMTWSYRGEATLDVDDATGYEVLPLKGSVAIGGSDDSVSSTGSRHCTLASTGDNKPPGNFAVQSGIAASVGVFLPESDVTSTNCQLAGVECMPNYCSDACLPGPPTTSDNGGNPDPVWAPSFGPFKEDELWDFSRGVDMRPGAGTASNDSCFNGTVHEHEQVDVKSHVGFWVSWNGPTFFIDFPDGAAPSILGPGTPLKPGKSAQTTPTANIPPKVPLPPTDPNTTLLPGIGVGCPTTVKKCPTTITVTDGNKKLASATVSVKGGTVAIAGLRLPHLSVKAGASKKVNVAVSVLTGKTVHRGSRQVTLTRSRA